MAPVGENQDDAELNLAVAHRWCAAKGEGWSVLNKAGRGGTAPVFAVKAPDREYALKVYDVKFSSGARGELEEVRVEQQRHLGSHGCPHLVEVYEGSRFEDRLVLLMNRAPGRELEEILDQVPRDKIRSIIDKVARACIFLRARGICHRDIKSANIFVTEDFETVTLLDISVLRNIHDPVGIGTDHDNQLPVVATARYSPPEYLFRLDAYSEEYWHGLDIYQLGGVLHDLIMRAPLFASEYDASKENRYRFAWVVATTDPKIESNEVDADLVSLARRALDKNWLRRRSLALEDFLADAAVLRSRGLEMLGLRAKSSEQADPHHQPNRQRVLEVARLVESALQERLREQSITPTHKQLPGANDAARRLSFEWTNDGSDAAQNVKLDVEIGVVAATGGVALASALTLEMMMGDESRRGSLSLPEVIDGDRAPRAIASAVMAELGGLTIALLQSQSGGAS